jgi:hypothetical protein
MRPLPVRPLPVPTEPIMDYLERLANSNGYNLREFQTWFGSGQGICTATLTESLSGHQLPPFSGPANPQVKISVNSFGLQVADFTHMYRRWCPTCVALESWMRPVWRLKTATVCATHRIRLLQSCPRCHSYPDLQSILNGTCVCGVNFVEVLSQATRAEIQISQALDKSLAQPITFDLGEIEVELDTPQIVRLICYTGQFSKGPLLHRPGKIRDLESIEVASNLVAGTATLLADWPSAFWHCLERFVKAAPDDASIRRVFGPLYHVLFQDLRDPVFQFLRSSFELFLLEHWRGELCGRHRLFSEETINEHRHQGLARVARSAGLGSKRLRKMVHQDRFPANTFNPNSTKHLITVDKEVLARLLPNLNDYLDLRATARLLGFKRTRLRQLVAHGVLLADAKPDFGISNRWHFRRTEIEAYLADIRQSATQALSGDTATLGHALRYWRVESTELGELMKALKRGEINFAMPHRFRLCDLTFPSDELRSWLAKTRSATVSWISASKASELLSLKEQVVYELISKNLLVAEVVTKNGHAIRRISLPSLQEFKETYVSAAALARQHEISVSAMLRKIKATPITGPRIDGGRQYFFKRCEIGV